MNKLPIEVREARTAAQNQSQPRYQGRPCRRGHAGERWTRSGECVECSYLRDKQKYHTDHGKQRARTYYQNNLERKLWLGAKSRVAHSGREFNLAPEDVVIPSTCPVLGIPMTSPSLDRFDNTEGYTVGNTKVISLRANTLKNDATIEELEAILRYMKGEIEC